MCCAFGRSYGWMLYSDDAYFEDVCKCVPYMAYAEAAEVTVSGIFMTDTHIYAWAPQSYLNTKM